MAEVLDEEMLENLEKRIEDLRNQFEQYFLGSRKRAPEQDRTTVQFIIRRLSNQSVPNTRLRFRFQQMTAKFNSYNQYWNRVLQQIEAGTYFRDRFKAQLHAGAEEAPKASPARDDGLGPSKSDLDQLHKDLVNARKQLNQSTNVSKQMLADSIKKQIPKLQERYKGRDIKFKVVVENGQAKLKATLK